MHKIILIETSTALCSVALAVDGKIVGSRESDAPKAHASLTAVFIKELLDEQGLFVKDCDAVCVSAGPGSYTGLRVGASTAKGLCFAAGIPLLACGTLEVLAAQAAINRLIPPGCRYIIPMIDARRMEVYTARFTPEGQQLSEVEAVIVDENSFSAELSEGPVLFIGDGAAKCAEVINSDNAHFVQTYPHAAGLLSLAEREMNSGNFRDCAYFEPFYLKQFVATVSKKKLF